MFIQEMTQPRGTVAQQRKPRYLLRPVANHAAKLPAAIVVPVICKALVSGRLCSRK